MSYLYAIDQEAQAKLSDQLDNVTPQEQGPGFWGNFGSAVAADAAIGVVKLGELGMRFPSSPQQYLTESVLPDYGAQMEKARAAARSDMARKAQELTPNPLITGTGSQVVGGLAQVLPTAIAGTAIAGPIGAAALVGGSQGVGDYEQSLLDGIDPQTAARKAAVTGGVAGLGVVIPVSKIGASLSTNLAIGAGVNVPLGMAQRAVTGKILADAGYHDMAKQYQWLDEEALAIDTVMGLAFGGLGHFMGRGVSHEKVDAALKLNERQHVEVEAQPGVHRTPESRDAGVEAFTKATEDMLVHDRSPDVAELAAKMDMEPNPETRAFHEELAKEIEKELPKQENLADYFNKMGIEAGARPEQVTRYQAEHAWTKTETDAKTGMPTWENDKVSLGNPHDVTEGHDVFYKALGKDRAIDYDIKDKDGNVVGNVVLEMDGDFPKRLLDININKDKQRGRHGENTVAAITADAGELGIWNIIPSARSWWERVGTRTVDAGDGIISFKDYADARASRENAGGMVPDARGTRPDQAVTQPKPHDNTPESMARAGDVQPIERQMAQQILDTHPDLEIPTGALDADGKPATVKFSELVAQADNEIQMAQRDGALHDIAVACFLRG